MSASSSVSSSSLSRPKGAVLIVAALFCAYGSYYLWRSVNEELETSSNLNTSLHRSNAIHRRRRRTNTGNLDGRPNPIADLQAEIGETEGGNNNPLARTLTDGETVVDDGETTQSYEWNNPPPYERNGQNIVQLLFRVSEDATRRNAYVHRGCECNSCGTVPIRGIRYHCANCADYDLCEGCESQGLHIKTHIFYKIRVPAPSFGPILSMPVAYSGDPDSVEMRNLPKELTTKLSRETGFERPELDAYWEQWTFMANTEWREDPDEIGLAMDRKTFEHCLVPSGGYRQAAPSLIFDRMFAFYDTNHDDLISFPEFLHGIAYRKKKDKWSKIFQGYDIDGDGYVDRKDFLRMFRSYYALYRQMHRDMLGGMQEQQMVTSTAHELVSGRQPLSSVFGANHYPRGVDIRAGEGKTVQPNGELEINDGKGVINESGNDTGSREEVFRQNTAPSGFWNRERGASAYWETMLNPPHSIEQLSDNAGNPNRLRGPMREINGRAETAGPFQWGTQDAAPDDSSSDDYDSSTDSIFDPENDHTWMPDDITLTDEDAEAVDGPGTRLADLRRSSRRAVIVHAIARERTNMELRERWKRRQFYTDEEEGATAPRNWKEEDDILVQNATVGESSKTKTRPPLHSRSSSKVRFAEDMDDFDTRSNPSTSSRSVPERWGGIEIPDAERDSGREILFQVTQQAFNELLDPLFHDKEDQAIKAAERKADLDKYRPQYASLEFEQWLREQKERMEREEREGTTGTTMPDPPKLSWAEHPILSPVDIPNLRQRSLEELLEASGYQISSEAEQAVVDPENAEAEGGARNSKDESPNTGEARDQGAMQASSSQSAIPQPELLPAPNDGSDDPRNGVPSLDEVSTHTPRLNATDGLYHDPTMPQFMPDSITSRQPADVRFPFPEFVEPVPTPHAAGIPNGSTPSPSVPTDAPRRERRPSLAFLLRLWKIDQDAREAERRGGWGRLNFEEFETRVKAFVKEGKGNQMDYLGSWIEFCIP